MQQMRKSLCADPRDRVYAPLGLANKVVKDSITIDYNCEVEDLYKQTAKFLVTASVDPLVLLGAVGNDLQLDSFRAGQTSSLPSRVPDWRQPCSSSSFSEEQLDLDTVLYDPFPGNGTPHIGQDGVLIIAEALVLHTVEIVMLTDTWI